MKFRIEKKALERVLDVPSRCVAKTTTLPILTMFKIELSGDNLNVTASDGNNVIIANANVEGVEDGVVCIDAKKLTEVLGFVAEGAIEFSSDGVTAMLSSVEGSGRYSMPAYDAIEYPKAQVVEGETFSVPADIFSGMLSSVAYAASGDDLRPVLCGVCADLRGGKLTLVATNTRVMSMAEREMDCPIEKTVLIPSRAVSLLTRVLQYGGDVSLTSSDKRAMFVCGNIAMSCSLSEGRFPNYRAVLPKDMSGSVRVERAALLNCTLGVMSCGSKSSNLVAMEMKPLILTMRANDEDFGTSAVDSVVCEGCADLTIGVNGANLSAVLRSMKSEGVNIEVSSAIKPMLISPANDAEFKVTALVMPMMLNYKKQ